MATREELSKAARRFTTVVEGLGFSSVSQTDKNLPKPTYEVKRGASIILFADSEEEAKECANKLNNLTEPFIQEELKRLQNIVEKDLVS